MKNKHVGKASALTISVYKKDHDRLSLVLRKKERLYRLSTVGNAKAVLKKLKGCASPEQEQVLEMYSPQNRHWILEKGFLNETDAVLNLWELERDGMKLRFNWNGLATELQLAFSAIRA